MSTEPQIRGIDEEIHNYIQGAPLGRSTKDIYNKFTSRHNDEEQSEYTQDQIDKSINRLETNDWIMERQGKFVSINMRR